MSSSASIHTQPTTAAFILAGGQSTRMGQDKALVSLAGKPLIQHSVDLLCACGLEPQIAGARTDLTAYAPVVPDDTPDCGPLSGICTALRHATAELALFLPVDLPLMPASLLRYLLFHAQITGHAVTLASVSAFTQTFPAVIRRDALPTLEAELRAGRSGCIEAFRCAGEGARAAASQETGGTSCGLSVIPVEMVVQSGHVADPRALPPFRWFSNVNTPQELESLEPLSRNLNLEHG